MWIVTLCTADTAFGFDKAVTLVKPIGMVVDFKVIGQVVVSIGFKIDHEIAKRLAGPETIIILSKFADEAGSLTHRLKVALIANVVLKLR